MPSAPLRLRCEFVHNPLGITAARPRLSWWVEDQRAAEIQSAYEIFAASSCELLGIDEPDLWRSGRVDSPNSAHIEYDGAELAASQRVWWKVRTFDSDGLGSAWSEPAFFEMGLATNDDWQGRWIASPLAGSRSRGVQASALRREFYLGSGVERATLYVAALGDYKFAVNGTALPALHSAAVWCDYSQECYYQTFDVADHLDIGTNVFSVLLADGFYAGSIPGLGRTVYGARAAIRIFLKVDLEDGQQLSVASDETWRWYPSWILAADINGGEHVDFNQVPDGWQRTGFDDNHWSPVRIEPAFAGELRSQLFPALNVTQVLRPLELPPLPRRSGRVVMEYDFGKAIVGRVRVSLRSFAPDNVQVQYSLNDQFTKVGVDAYSTTAGALEGGHVQICEPEFALHSFRYARVEFTQGVSEIEDLLALRIAYPEQPALKLRSDHATLNELINVLDNSISGVALSVPMRGVELSQRLPHAGYAATWVPMFAQQERSHALITKWLWDMVSSGRSGEPASAFVPALGQSGGPVQATADAVADPVAQFETFVQVLWAIYRHQDDLRTLEQFYPEVRIGALSYQRHSHTLVRQDADPGLYGAGAHAGLVATATLYGTLKLAGRMALILGELDDIAWLNKLADDLRTQFRQRFLTLDGYLAGDSQSVYVAALANELLEGHEVNLAERGLINLLQTANYHADVVPMVLRHLLPALSNAGRLDMAYMVLLQTSQPSWFGNINAGEQLVARHPGRFDIAEIGLIEWLVESMVGIAVDEDYAQELNGYRRVRIQPMPPLGKQFLAGSPINMISASLSTLQGLYEVGWEIKENCFELDVLIPPSCTAVVVMPDGIEYPVRSGRHSFIMDFGAGGDGVPTLLDVNVG